jgi:hypothetical protein
MVGLQIPADNLTYLVMKLMEMDETPTFMVVRHEAGPVLWLSKRTHDALRDILAAAKTAGEF